MKKFFDILLNIERSITHTMEPLYLEQKISPREPGCVTPDKTAQSPGVYLQYVHM